MKIAQVFKIFSILLLFACLQVPLRAQQDSAIHKNDSTARKGRIEEFLKRQKGMIGKLASNLVGDTTARSDQENAPIRNDLSFNQYENLAIRSITIERLDFGELITDSTKNFKNSFTRLANKFHHKSREYVIRNNLFFKAGDRVASYLLADNERHLRDQPYIQDAKIIVQQSEDDPDSADIIVRVKDVLSIGGSFELHNPQSAEMSVKEDNLDGWGNTVSVGSLYDQQRKNKSGIAIQYVNRNIGGSFIDGYAGYTTFGSAFNTGYKQEQNLYGMLIKPLVNPYTKWTYSLEAANHSTRNMFQPDSTYQRNSRYHYFNYDAWVGWNTGAYKLTGGNADNRMRTLLSLRYFKQLFLQIPGKYANQYYFQYADITGVLGAVSIFKQNFYKAQYFYGFGRNEDVPEGVDMSLTAGWINKQGAHRPYVGVDVQRYYFSRSKAYYNFTLRAGGYWANKRAEDVNFLFSVDHYSRLQNLGGGWKQRTVLNASLTGQVHQVYNAPLQLESLYGLNEWKNSITAGGDFRATLRMESVFFSPIKFINFHFAPFVFANLCMMTPLRQNLEKSDLYSSIGGGIRTRNESLIFGTFELKAYYFPRKTFINDTWRIETNTSIKFKYNSQYIKRPSVINVN